jgi:hypothetical protein
MKIPPLKEGPRPDKVRISSWVPCSLLVEDYPAPEWATIEWYAPIDDRSHQYWQITLKLCRDETERQAAQEFYATVGEPIGLREFNGIDIVARERLQEHYQHSERFGQETLFAGDVALVSWRKLAARFNRGIQEPPNP